MLSKKEEKSTWYIFKDMTGWPFNLTDINNSIVYVIPDLGPQYQLSITFMYTLLAVITAASLLVIALLAYIFKQNKSLAKNSVNIFILNIIFVDLLRCVIHVPVYSASIKSALVHSEQNFPFMMITCNLNSILSVFFETVQLFSFLAISYERFKIVHSPFLNANKRVSLAKILLVFTWFISSGLTACVIFLVSYFSDYKNFSTVSKSCYLDVYSLVIDVYYNPADQEIVYDRQELDLRNWQVDCIAYFVISISTVSFTLSGYFYTRIILFLKFHEKNVFSKLAAKVSNKIEPGPTLSTTGGDKLDIPVCEPVKQPKFAIVEENDMCVSLPRKVAISVQLENVPLACNMTDTAPTKTDQKESVIEIHGDDGVVMIRKKQDIGKHPGEVKLEGDVCLANAGVNNKNRERGKRRLEVRTAKKTFIIMISFVLCQMMFLITVVIHKLPVFTQNQFVADNFIILSKLGVFFTIFSYLSCFLNSFTFILVTDFFKNEAKRLLNGWKEGFINFLKRDTKNTVNN